MIRIGIRSLAVALLAWLAGQTGLRAQSIQPPDFKEVYDLIRAHLPGISEAELDRTAVQALVSALGPRVTLVNGDELPAASSTAPLLARVSVFDGGMGYLRVGRVGDGLEKSVRQACDALAATNKLKGVVLDLRFAGGEDYAAAASTADLFVRKERPLLDWGHGVVKSSNNKEAIAYPIAVLVNHQTAAAAEALAGVLRETGAGLILGSKTAGMAMIAQDYPLKGGGHLRIASAPIQLGDGTALSAQGLSPDISVQVAPQDEQAYFEDAFKRIPGAKSLSSSGLPAANTPDAKPVRRPRFNEAELVRERREGYNPDADTAPVRDSDQEKPAVQDPALARALDVLKGLAVIRQIRS